MAIGALAVAYTSIIESVSVYPIWVVFWGGVGYILCSLCFKTHGEQLSAFVQTFCAGLTAIAISRTAAVFLDDPLQNASDAGSFFEAAAHILHETDLYELRTIINGWGAVWAWSKLYAIDALVSPASSPVVGVVFNAFLMAFGGSVIVDAAAAIGGVVSSNVRTAKRLFVWCFAFWLCASFHLRDAMTVFLTIVTIRVWIGLHQRFSINRVIVSALVFGSLFWLIGTVREESSSIVLVASVVGLTALFARAKGPIGVVIGILGLLVLFAAYQVIYVRILGFTDVLKFYQEGYQYDASGASLGHRLIVSQSAPVRTLLGFAYLHVFPIPMWNGFALNSSYYWFKSAQSVHMVFLLPAAVAGTLRLWRLSGRAKEHMVFLVGLYVIIAAAVALSSLETRHYTQVLPCLILLSAVKHSGDQDKRYRLLFVIALGVIHVFWAILKFM